MSTAELAAPVAPVAAEHTPEQIVEAIYGYAARKMHSGASWSKIKRSLVDEQGLNVETAETVVANLKKARSQALREAGPKNMLVGALWCIGGTVVTAATYQMASGSGGGHYIIAWGAVLFGAIQFLRGLFQAIRGLF